jgi:hypothetical protein
MHCFDATSHHFEYVHDFQNIQSQRKYRVSKLGSQLHQNELSDTARYLEAAFTFLHITILIFHWHFNPNNFNNSEHQLTVVLG